MTLESIAMGTSNVANTRGSQSDVVVPGAALMRAAYILGRNLYLLKGWLEAVGTIARHRDVGRPWKWDYPYTLFGGSYDAWPQHHYSEVEDALRTLVLAKLVDHAALVELHRLLDMICRDCGDVAEFAAADLSEQIGDTHWHARYITPRAVKIRECLLADAPERLRALQRLGSQIGELMTSLAHCWDYEIYIALLNKTATLAEELFPTGAQQLKNLRHAIPTAAARNLADVWKTCRLLLDSLTELDSWILEQAPLPKLSLVPYVILDDRRRTMSFLDIEIPFEEFAKANALAGLSILRVLIQRPGDSMTVRKIFELSESCSESHPMSEYLSRYRNVLKRTERFWPLHIKQGKDYYSATQGFILPDRLRRKQSPGNDSWYRLDLPPYRVRYVPVGLI